MADLKARALIFSDVRRAVVSAIDVPSPEAGLIRLRTLACGLCWREIHVYNGKLQREYPLIMGHEPVGIVEEIGPAVEGFKVGDIVTAIGQSALAEYSLVEAKYTSQVSPLIEPVFSLGEPAMCALAAVRQAQPRKGDFVVVNGAGFMGQLLIQALLNLKDVIVVAVDLKQENLSLAEQAGAKCLFVEDFNPDKIKREFGRLSDIVFEASGAAGTIWPATQCVRNGGKLCLFGHHFFVEPEAVNDWHLRGIAVLNTVPWGSPDLARDFRDAVKMLNAGEFNLGPLISHQAELADTPALMELASARPNGFLKGVVVF